MTIEESVGESKYRRTSVIRRELRPLGKGQIQQLVMACVTAILKDPSREPSIVLVTSKATTFADDFPLGHGVKHRENNLCHYKIKAKALLNWLHDKGYTPINPQAIRLALMQAGQKGISFDGTV